MAIEWNHYIEATTKKLAQILFPGTHQSVKTRMVSPERINAAELLNDLKFSADHQVFVGISGFLLVLRAAGGQKHAVLFSNKRDVDFLTEVQNLTINHNLVPIEHTDAHFFFLVDKLDLPLAEDVTSQGLGVRLNLQQLKNNVSIDFDEAVKCYGSVFAWEFDLNLYTHLLQLLLFTEQGNESLSWSSIEKDYGLSNIQSPQLKLIDLCKLCGAITRPVAKASDTNINYASISIADTTQLVVALTEMEVPKQDVFLSIGGGACFEFSHSSRKLLAVSLRNYYPFEIELVFNMLNGLGLNEVDLEDAHFLSFFLHFGEYIDLKPMHLSSPESILNQLDVKTEWQVDLKDVRDVYEEIKIYDVSNCSELTPLKVLCHLATGVKSARSTFIPSTLSTVAYNLIQIPKIPYENVYLSLTANHWKHSFLEIYRVIEGLYYFGWMKQLKLALDSPLTEHELALKCKNSASWTYGEHSSIQKLFEVVPREVIFSCNPLSIPCLIGRFNGKDDTEFMRTFASAVYSIRNSNVHQGEHSVERTIDVTANCWPKLTNCLFLIVEYFYSYHGEGMPPESGFQKFLIDN